MLKKVITILGFVGVLFGYVLFAAEGGKTASAVCTRAELNGPVNCERQLNVLWIIPLEKTKIHNVKSVIWDEIRWWDEGWCYAYSIDLGTDQGKFPLSPYHSSGGAKI